MKSKSSYFHPTISKRFSDEEVYKLFYKFAGNQSAIINALECTPPQFKYWLKQKEERKIELEKSREKLVDMAEASLMNLLSGNDPKVVLETAKFILQNQGRSRGWYGNAPSIQTITNGQMTIQQIFGLPEQHDNI